jgi:hypothetical protein
MLIVIGMDIDFSIMAGTGGLPGRVVDILESSYHALETASQISTLEEEMVVLGIVQLQVVADRKLMKKGMIKTQLQIILASVITVSAILVYSTVFAGPTLAPFNGNPIIPGPPQGPQGSQGPQGYSGAQGPQGYTGGQGPAGDNGVLCNFPGYGLYFSHGWDGGCAWNAGISMSCGGNGRTANFNGHYGCWHNK